VNKYLVEMEPWAVAERQDQSSRSRLATILYTAAEALRITAALVHPVIPEATAKIWQQLGAGDIARVRFDQLKWAQLPVATKLGNIEPVFPRADKSVVASMHEKEAEYHKVRAEAPESKTGSPQKAKPARDAREPKQKMPAKEGSVRPLERWKI